jgi:hypothetical protein
MRTLLAATVVLALACISLAQPGPVGSPPAGGAGGPGVQPGFPDPGPVGTGPRAPEKTLDQIFDELEQLRAQKAELEKKENVLIQEALKRMEKQTERARQLGVVPTGPRPGGPPGGFPFPGGPPGPGGPPPLGSNGPPGPGGPPR